MKNLLIFALLFIPLDQIEAQNFSIAVYNETFTSCPVNYENLEKLPINKIGFTDKFTKKGKPFTGCAKTILKDDQEIVREYLVADIKEGYPTKVLYYFPDGTLSREFNFKDGRSHGKHTMYYEDGGKYIEENYEFGRKHGSIKRWTDDGKLARDAFYNLGMPIYDIEYFKDKRGC